MKKFTKLLLAAILSIGILYAFTAEAATGTYTGVNFSVAAQSSNAYGIAWDGSAFWVVENGGTEVYKYNSAGTYSGTHFDTAASGNVDPHGIAWDGTYFYVVNQFDASTFNPDYRVFKYTAAGSYTGTAFSLSFSPDDITWDGTYFWVVSANDNTVYQLNSSGTQTGVSFAAGSGNYSITGIAYDPSGLWVSDDSNDTVYGYTTAGISNGTSFSISGSGNNDPRGFVIASNFFWITDPADDKVYKYEGAPIPVPPHGPASLVTLKSGSISLTSGSILIP